jgi:uncharacterized protein YbbK (DUF523 family)
MGRSDRTDLARIRRLAPVTGEALPRVAISACLLGAPVRYDGADKGAAFDAGTWRGFVAWVPVCPEVEVGMPVPREPIRVEVGPHGVRLLGVESRADWTLRMTELAARRLERLERDGPLDGWVWKARSPSCGPSGVPLHDERGAVVGTTSGLFAAAVRALRPHLPVADDGTLASSEGREQFQRSIRRRSNRAL